MNILTPDKMTEQELVAVILGKKSIDYECVQIAHLVLSDGATFNSDLADIAREGTPSSFKRMEKIHAAVELGRRSMMNRQPRHINSATRPEDVVELIEPLIAGLDKEVFYCIALNTKFFVRKLYEVSVGSLSSSIVHPREAFRTAIEVSAASVVFVHNHPSGDPQPSGADIQLTRRLAKAGDVLGIELLDHVVLGGGGNYASMRDAGLF